MRSEPGPGWAEEDEGLIAQAGGRAQGTDRSGFCAEGSARGHCDQSREGGKAQAMRPQKGDGVSHRAS